MDSGNSGSLNSSSGGDDDQYDSSRTESISAFLLNSSNQQPPLPPLHHHHNHQQSSTFDPLSAYLDPFSRSPPTQTPNSLLNLDMVWTKNLTRTEPNCTTTNDILMGSSSSAQPQHGSGRFHFPNDPSSISLQPTAAIENGARGSVSSHDQQTTTTRNSKKRSRASRRAPTTVLTTDTSNFRAMVQEFTGIPASPFSSSLFPRSRFDLFNPTTKSCHLETAPPPPYLLRPFPHKVQLPSFSTSITTTTSTTSNSTSTNNYQPPSEIGLSKEPHHHQNLVNMQNPIQTFQSLLQSGNQLANVSMFGDKPKTGPESTINSLSTDSQLKMGGVLEEFSMSNGAHVNTHLGGLSNIVTTSNEMSLRSNINTNWRDHNEVVVSNNNGDHADHQSHLGSSFNGNIYSNLQRVSTNCKMNFSASSSDFHTDKGSSEKGSLRGEGMLDSWICTSD